MRRKWYFIAPAAILARFGIGADQRVYSITP